MSYTFLCVIFCRFMLFSVLYIERLKVFDFLCLHFMPYTLKFFLPRWQGHSVCSQTELSAETSAGQCCYCEDGYRCPAGHNNSAQGDIFELLWGKVELCRTHKFIDKFTYVRWKKQTSCLVAPVFHLVVETCREFVQLVNVCLRLFFSSGFIWLQCIPLFGMLVEFGKEGFRFSLIGNYDFFFF